MEKDKQVLRQEAQAYRLIENGEMDVEMKYIKSQKYLVKMYIGMFIKNKFKYKVICPH